MEVAGQLVVGADRPGPGPGSLLRRALLVVRLVMTGLGWLGDAGRVRRAGRLCLG